MTALRKFKIDTKNSEDYVLIQIDKEKSVHSLVKQDDIILDLENDSFYLCDKLTASNILSKSSKNCIPSPVRRSKLHTVEVQMANIEASILDSKHKNLYSLLVSLNEASNLLSFLLLTNNKTNKRR